MPPHLHCLRGCKPSSQDEETSPWSLSKEKAEDWEDVCSTLCPAHITHPPACVSSQTQGSRSSSPSGSSHFRRITDFEAFSNVSPADSFHTGRRNHGKSQPQCLPPPQVQGFNHDGLESPQSVLECPGIT